MAVLSLMLALGACVQPATSGIDATPSAPLRVTNNGAPFANDEGAAARKTAEATCRGRGQRLRSGIYDRFEAGTWVYPGGCA